MINKVFILFLLSTVFVFGQENQEKSQKEKFSITVSSTHLIDPWDGSSIRIGIEKPLNNFIINLEAGKYIANSWSIKPNIKGYILNPIVKFKVYTNDNGVTEYVGVDYLYKDFSHDTNDSIKINNVTINKDYRVSRKVHAVSLKYFQRKDFNKHFFYDFYVGLGIRFTSSQSDLTEEERYDILNDEYHGATQIENEINRTGKFFRPNIYCGVKFGYRIF
ncbi:hypothetical protein [Flavobacterium terrigena]|uniref:DUF3575 domain-containing protein n=1 Tax=Flavobacterium terrigena TaxID=402734 RepID=A0A1H6QHE3_9FLAO|nr:hypothetical protein [Flavobacterium terrigena]SEI43148.1 hypothetical protein SAMN05660918_0530 [Flavobacterium terrigena]